MNQNNLKFTKNEAQRILLKDDKSPYGGTECYEETLDHFLTTIGEFVFVEIFGDGKRRDCDIRTVGQLRIFLTILGLEDFVKQLKS